MKNRITVIGHAAYDYIFNVARQPTENRSSYIDSWKRCHGGGAANISVGIAHHGGTCRLYTIAGTDFGRYENYLRKKKVDLVLVPSNKKTARAYIFNAKGHYRMYFSWGASEDMDTLRSIKSTYLHIAPCHPALAVKMSDNAKFFAFEPGQDLQKFDASSLTYLVEHADIIFCNATEFSLLKKMVSVTGKNIIVTLGGGGSMVFSTGEKIPIVTPRRIVDVTGAGDAYKAGFWMVYLETNDILSACKMGATMASFIVENYGAQSFPSNEILLRRYNQHFR